MMSSRSTSPNLKVGFSLTDLRGLVNTGDARLIAFALVASLAACFQPQIDDGQFACGEGQVCPPGFVCDQGLCVSEIGPGTPDAQPPGLQRAEDPSLLYLFDEGDGAVVRDQSGREPAFDLTIAAPGNVDWQPGSLILDAPTLISRPDPPSRLIDDLQRSNAVTVEAWIHPADAVVDGPRRILTLSEGTDGQTLVMGQGGDVPTDFRDVYLLRLRTTDVQHIQGKPAIETDLGTARTVLTHLVYVREASGQVRAYIDGAKVLETFRGGDFSVWNTSHRLGIGNERTGDRQFRGVLHLIAVYDRALSDAEVAQNLAAGPDPEL
jgi:hypothetical protein